MSNALMRFDPATGAERPYPSHAEQWRRFHGATAWLFNPWSGARRCAQDVGSDVFGRLCVPSVEAIDRAEKAKEALGR